MVEISRRAFVGRAAAAGIASVNILTRRAEAADIRLKFANDVPFDHPLSFHCRAANKRILDESGGKIDIRMFTDGRLGNNQLLLRKLRAGAIEFLTLSPSTLATLVPVAAISGIGFAFKDYEAVWSALDGGLGALVRAAIGKTGLHVFDKIWDNGYRQITGGPRAITAPEDLQHFKIRVPGDPLRTSLFQALGAEPAKIEPVEVYAALHDASVDGEESPIGDIVTAKLWEVQKYCSLTNHSWDGFWLLGNAAAWSNLAPKQQEIIVRNFDRAAVAYRSDLAKLTAEATADLEANGMVFNQTDWKPFRAALAKAGFYAAWKAKFDGKAWAELEKYSGRLG
jgi:tripartite ATP-independent transporter DctP family solute receptor